MFSAGTMTQVALHFCCFSSHLYPILLKSGQTLLLVLLSRVLKASSFARTVIQQGQAALVSVVAVCWIRTLCYYCNTLHQALRQVNVSCFKEVKGIR
jgi:hypothetical protein